MDLKILHGRVRRGWNKRGLKLGRSGIRALTDLEFQTLKASIKHDGSIASRRNARSIKRQLQLLRNERSERTIVVRRGYVYNHMMDTLYPNRGSDWTLSWLRNKKQVVKLSNFSFLDEPKQTLDSLVEIVKAECQCKHLYIDFDDEDCLDIAPYMLLGIMKQQMIPVVRGGHITDGIRSILQAVDLDKFINMRKASPSRENPIFPFKMRQRRPTGTSTADNRSEYVTSEERASTQLADTVNRWLGCLERPRMLTRNSRAHILTLIGEVLDNAKRHGDLKNHDGTWSIAGFMEVRARHDGTFAYACNLGIVNPGATIYESLQAAPEHIVGQLSQLTRFYEATSPQGSINEETLWTFSSLQDGVSRVPTSPSGAPGGFGMMSLIGAINALGRSSRSDEQPSLTIISGSSCVMVREPYRTPTTSRQGHRVLAFNAANRLDELPDPAYVFTMPHRLAGTCVSVRFFLDETELAEAAKRRNDQDA